MSLEDSSVVHQSDIVPVEPVDNLQAGTDYTCYLSITLVDDQVLNYSASCTTSEIFLCLIKLTISLKKLEKKS